MQNAIDSFMFLPNVSNVDTSKSFVIRIPINVSSKEELIDIYRKSISFYSLGHNWGLNWDALWEVLCDLRSVKENKIIIIHEKLPITTDKDSLKIYLKKILIDIVAYWESHSEHKVLVIFPDTDRMLIRAVLNGADADNID